MWVSFYILYFHTCQFGLCSLDTFAHRVPRIKSSLGILQGKELCIEREHVALSSAPPHNTADAHKKRMDEDGS